MHNLTRKILFLLSDFSGTLLGWLFVFYLKYHSGLFAFSPPISFQQAMITGVVLGVFWVILFVLFGLYDWKISTSRVDEIFEIGKIIFGGCLALLLLTADFQNPVSVGRFFIVGYFLSLLALVGIGRLLVWTLHIHWLVKLGGLYRTAVIGYNEPAIQIFDKLKANPELGFKPIGFICDNGMQEEKVLGPIADIEQIIKKQRVTDVIFAIDSSHHKSLLGHLYKIDQLPVRSYIHPDLYDIVTGQTKLIQIYGIALMSISMQLIPWWENQIKRLLDILISVIGLVLSAPISLITAIFIKFDSKGGVIFKQKRIGKDGQMFCMYKFRSMYEKSDDHLEGYKFAKDDDPRVTKVGRWIRKWRLDEIPQFINILKGDMSFVGPRPDAVGFFEENINKIPFYHRRLLVRPGLTGYAQIRQNYHESNVEVEKKLRYDLYYVENLSVRLDLKIVLSTIRFLLLGKGR